jgi:hypothetical protein
MKWVDYVEVSDKSEISYKGIYLGITVTNLTDYIMLTGFEPDGIIQKLYNDSLIKMRDDKLNEILA